MNKQGPWNIHDYESLSWHDAHVYGFWFENIDPENGSSDLVLDIDYILKWEENSRGFIFTVSQAELTFKNIFGLKMHLDYKTPTIGMSPFMIKGIYRELIKSKSRYVSYNWKIPVSCPVGCIEFEAPTFEQKLVGKPVISESQHLDLTDRVNKNVF